MKAVMCKEWGPAEALVVEDVPAREPGPGEVRVRVRAAGVNFPDVLIIQKKYQVQPPLPFTPGSEAAGEVISVGEGVTHVKAGDAVMAYAGIGCFAEEVVAPADKIVPIPAGLSFDVAAAFTLTYGTSWHAIRDRAALKAGEPHQLAVDKRMVVPAGVPLRIQTTASDVIHAFAVPSLWFKMDAVPGRLNEKLLTIKEPGVYYGQCSELCGARHGYMPIVVEALPPAEFAAWVKAQGGEMPGEKAEAAATPAAAAPAPAAPAAAAPAA